MIVIFGVKGDPGLSNEKKERKKVKNNDTV
jgi:hypothetical protein